MLGTPSSGNSRSTATCTFNPGADLLSNKLENSPGKGRWKRAKALRIRDTAKMWAIMYVALTRNEYEGRSTDFGKGFEHASLTFLFFRE